jgi:hypothetical protein
MPETAEDSQATITAPMHMRRVPPGAQAAVLAALTVHANLSRGLSPWMSADNLAASVGAPDINDADFQGAVQSLFDAGAIRLMSGGNASGKSFYKAMIVPAA